MSTQKIPEEIQQVAKAWRANAKEADMPKDACYVSYEEKGSRQIKEYYIDYSYAYEIDGKTVYDFDCRLNPIEGPHWLMMCNYGRGGTMIWFPKQDVWLRYQARAEGCTRMEGGLSEAMACAEIYYTG